MPDGAPFPVAHPLRTMKLFLVICWSPMVNEVKTD